MARSSLFPPSVKPGKPILPACPPGWTTVSFSDVLEVVERPVNLIDDVEYQLVTAKRSRGGVVARSRLLGRDVLTKTQFQIARDDFLMSNRQIIHGGCGIVPPALDGAVVSNEYSVLRTKSKLLLEFLTYLSHSIYFQQTCFHASVGVDVEKMIFDCERWLDFRIHLPPLHEQRRIAEILSSVDEAIAATRAVIEQTRKVKQGVLERLLAKGIGHTRFKQTEIGEIPEGWNVFDLRDLLDRAQYGTSAPCSYEATHYPVIRIPNVSGEAISFEDLKFADLTPNEATRYILEQGDLLVIRTNGNRNFIGRMKVFESAVQPCLFASYLIRLKARRDMIRPEWIYVWSSRKKSRDFLLKSAATSAGNYNINLESLKSLRLAVPPISEQEAILDKLSAFDAELEISSHNLANAELVKAALMSDLLTGRNRVTGALPMAAE